MSGYKLWLKRALGKARFEAHESLSGAGARKQTKLIRALALKWKHQVTEATKKKYIKAAKTTKPVMIKRRCRCRKNAKHQRAATHGRMKARKPNAWHDFIRENRHRASMQISTQPAYTNRNKTRNQDTEAYLPTKIRQRLHPEQLAQRLAKLQKKKAARGRADGKRHLNRRPDFVKLAQEYRAQQQINHQQQSSNSSNAFGL